MRSKKDNALSFSAVVAVREYVTTVNDKGEEESSSVEKTGLHSFQLQVG